MRWTLFLTTVPDDTLPWRQYVLHPDQHVTIGRTAGADLVIASCSVSRRHAALWFEDGRWMVQDVASTSGTYVDEAQIASPAPLPSGSTLRLGAVRFNATFGAPDALPSIPLRPAAPPNGTYRVVLRDGAVWTVACEDYVAFTDAGFPGGDPFWPIAATGEIDLRHAPRAHMAALLEAADFECGRTQLRPSTFYASMQELARLLRADFRLRTPPPTEDMAEERACRARLAGLPTGNH